MRLTGLGAAPRLQGPCGSPRCNAEMVPSSGAQPSWATLAVATRLAVMRKARHLLAQKSLLLADAISPLLSRSRADTLVSEVLPLLDACKFLEENAIALLKPRRLGRKGQPFWLAGVQAEIYREPLGHVLVIGPSNFPLFLPATQSLQALVAGNIVTWKPGTGGFPVASLFAELMLEAGLPTGILTITDESVESAQHSIAAGVDKVVFTGSSTSGQNLLLSLASTATPAVLELSGADAVVVMPEADLSLVARTAAFGLGLNGGAVCMSPRRLFATPATMKALRPVLMQALAQVRPVSLSLDTTRQLECLLEEATGRGARLLGELQPMAQRPLLIDRATPNMKIATTDLFAPVLSLIEVESVLHVPAAYNECRFALTVSIFCSKNEVKRSLLLTRMMKAGTVLINDLIAPTADPRTPFGGRGASGYGVTRGSEGLLEMTAVKTVFIRRGGKMRHLNVTTNDDSELFSALISLSHGSNWMRRLRALKELLQASWNRR